MIFMRKQNPHETPPELAEVPAELIAKMKIVEKSDYFKNLQPLKAHVKNRKVISSKHGNAGFILLLEEGLWAAAFREGDVVASAMGKGKPPQSVLDQISSAAYGDTSSSIGANVPYADQFCDIASELCKSHGHTITALSIGENTFNFAFDDGHELDFMLVNDNAGTAAFRVFWEQW